MAEYTRPSDVTAPKDTWRITKIIRDGGARDWSLAEGIWEKETVIAIRWNGHSAKPNGFPFTRFHPNWFVVPKDLEPAIRLAVQALRLNTE